MKSWLEKHTIEMYSRQRTAKNEIYKYVTSISKNIIIAQLK